MWGQLEERFGVLCWPWDANHVKMEIYYHTASVIVSFSGQKHHHRLVFLAILFYIMDDDGAFDLEAHVRLGARWTANGRVAV